MNDDLKTGLGWFFIWLGLWLGLCLGIGGCVYLENVSIGERARLQAEAQLIEAQAEQLRFGHKKTEGDER